MKKILLVVAFCVVALGASADDRSKALLESMSSKMSNIGAFKVDFSASLGLDTETYDGHIVVGGQKYYIEVNGTEVFFDGQHRYTYSDENEEVVIETPNVSDNSLLYNPARFFMFYDSDYTHKYIGTQTVNAKELEVVELRPINADAGYQSLRLFLDRSTSKPVLVKYVGGMSVQVAINKISSNVAVDRDTFKFDLKKYPGVEVIDFR